MTLEILVGMIASGKTTYARKRADEGAIVVCHDDITQALHCRYRYEQGLREFYRRVEEGIAFAALNAGRDVVVDRTHLTAESRRRWIRWAADYASPNTFDGRGPLVRVVAVEFPRKIAHVHARRRYEGDPRGRTFEEWSRVALHHQEQAEKEPLSAGEGFDEIVRIGEVPR